MKNIDKMLVDLNINVNVNGSNTVKLNSSEGLVERVDKKIIDGQGRELLKEVVR